MKQEQLELGLNNYGLKQLRRMWILLLTMEMALNQVELKKKYACSHCQKNWDEISLVFVILIVVVVWIAPTENLQGFLHFNNLFYDSK